jgi:LacI family transcriptional regulator
MGFMDRKVTIKDVAIEAGVSTATVGRVLHNEGYISDAAKQKVEQAIQKTGFRLNLVAQSLRRNRSMTIGHLLTSIVPNPFFAGIELGVEQEAIRHGYNVLLWNVLSNPEREREGIETFISRQIDAIIFTTPLMADNVLLVQQNGIPVIQVERPTRVDSHLVLIDNYIGAMQAMEHLIQLGHERIAFIGKKFDYKPERNLTVDWERMTGWHDTLIRHGIIPQPEWCCQANLYSVEDGFRATQHLLGLKQGITAILAACDIIASGVLQAIYQQGLRVPEDISVIGFDDTIAPMLTPALTSVRQPVSEIGIEAVKLAIEVLETPEESQNQYKTHHLETSLVVRQSTGVPRRSFPI